MAVRQELTTSEAAMNHVNQRRLITLVGVVPGELTKYDVQCLVHYAGSLSDISLWVLSDLLVWVEDKLVAEMGESKGRAFWEERERRWRSILSECKSDISLRTAYNMRATARSFPWKRRRNNETVSFEHHRLLLARPAEEQEEWLDLVEAGGWSSYRLRMELYKPVSAPEPPDLFIPARTYRGKWTNDMIYTRVSTISHNEGLTEDTAILLAQEIRDYYERMIDDGNVQHVHE